MLEMNIEVRPLFHCVLIPEIPSQLRGKLNENKSF